MSDSAITHTMKRGRNNDAVDHGIILFDDGSTDTGGANLTTINNNKKKAKNAGGNHQKQQQHECDVPDFTNKNKEQDDNDVSSSGDGRQNPHVGFNPRESMLKEKYQTIELQKERLLEALKEHPEQFWGPQEQQSDHHPSRDNGSSCTISSSSPGDGSLPKLNQDRTVNEEEGTQSMLVFEVGPTIFSNQAVTPLQDADVVASKQQVEEGKVDGMDDHKENVAAIHRLLIKVLSSSPSSSSSIGGMDGSTAAADTIAAGTATAILPMDGHDVDDNDSSTTSSSYRPPKMLTILNHLESYFRDVTTTDTDNVISALAKYYHDSNKHNNNETINASSSEKDESCRDSSSSSPATTTATTTTAHPSVIPELLQSHLTPAQSLTDELASNVLYSVTTDLSRILRLLKEVGGGKKGKNSHHKQGPAATNDVVAVQPIQERLEKRDDDDVNNVPVKKKKTSNFVFSSLLCNEEELSDDDDEFLQNLIEETSTSVRDKYNNYNTGKRKEYHSNNVNDINEEGVVTTTSTGQHRSIHLICREDGFFQGDNNSSIGKSNQSREDDDGTEQKLTLITELTRIIRAKTLQLTKRRSQE